MATATESLMHQILKLQAMKAKQPPLLFIATLLYYIPQIISDNFCGTNQTDAENTCWQPCSSDGDCCSRGQRCYEAGAACGSSLYEGTNHNYCGVSWCVYLRLCSVLVKKRRTHFLFRYIQVRCCIYLLHSVCGWCMPRWTSMLGKYSM